MANVTVHAFGHNGKHWVYIEDLLKALDGLVLETPIPWNKSEQRVINGKMAVQVDLSK